MQEPSDYKAIDYLAGAAFLFALWGGTLLLGIGASIWVTLGEKIGEILLPKEADDLSEDNLEFWGQ